MEEIVRDFAEIVDLNDGFLFPLSFSIIFSLSFSIHIEGPHWYRRYQIDWIEPTSTVIEDEEGADNLPPFVMEEAKEEEET